MTSAHTFTLRTDADTRSKARQVRTWTIDADCFEAARDSAVDQHLAICGWNTAIGTTVVDVDGNGAPADCEHYTRHIAHDFDVLGGRVCVDHCSHLAHDYNPARRALV